MSNDSTRRAEFTTYFEKHFGTDRQRFMDQFGVSKGRMTQYLDEEEAFGERAALNLEKRAHLPMGTMFPSLLRTGSEAARILAPEGVPVVGTAQLGDDGYFCELQYPVGHGDGRINWPTRDPNAYALRCKGESMKPRIRHGEFVVIEPNHGFNPGDEVLVRERSGKVMVKQLAYVRDGMVHLDSVNEAHPRISIPEDEVEVIQYVAGIAKSALWSND